MTLQASGPISAADINVELGRASTAPFDINGAAERALAGVPSGAISFSDFYGKSAYSFSVTAAPDLTKVGTASTLVTDGQAYVTLNGGVGPFTYQWYVINQTGDRTVTIDNPTSNQTYFRASLPLSGQTAICDAYCTVTDTSNGQVRNTNTVAIYIERSA